MCGGAEKSTCTTSLRIGHVGSHGTCEGPGMGNGPVGPWGVHSTCRAGQSSWHEGRGGWSQCVRPAKSTRSKG